MGPESVPVVNFMLGKDVQGGPPILEGFRKVQAAKTVDEVISLVVAYRLPWETVPTQFLREPALWKAFVENRTIGHTAILRNITRMEEIGCFKDLKFAKTVADILSDPEEVKKGRLHPVGFLNAWGAYGAIPGSGIWGSSVRQGSGSNPAIRGALEDGFYASFGNVEPSNARTMLAIDVSGSMTWAAPSGLKFMDARQAAAAMATVTLRTEPYVMVTAFSGGGWGRDGADAVSPVNVSSRDGFAQVSEKINKMPAGGTDCAAPMLYALRENIAIDHFVVYTDNETWAGKVHPDKALRDYRQKMGINAKLTVVGLTATNFTIADPSDAGMLDVVGFDSAAPRVIADFARVK
jgi:60 kDa SS-A/Ro ribonucleoprotein